MIGEERIGVDILNFHWSLGSVLKSEIAFFGVVCCAATVSDATRISEVSLSVMRNNVSVNINFPTMETYKHIWCILAPPRPLHSFALFPRLWIFPILQ